MFKSRRGVCAGYAQLLAALGRAAGREIVYVVGDARTQGAALSGEGHAWNAARVFDRWYLIDATWDSGGLTGAKFVKSYRAEYLMTPPEVFGLDHFPDDARWQLRDKPLSRGDFLRQPVLAPHFYELGLVLEAPDRSQVDVTGPLLLQLANPRGAFVQAFVAPRGGEGRSTPCSVDAGPVVRGRCEMPAPGAYELVLHAAAAQTGNYGYAGRIEVNAR